MVIGQRGSAPRPSTRLDHDQSEAYMDPRDLGIGVEPMKSEKREISWRELVLESSGWLNKGFSPWVEKVMT